MGLHERPVKLLRAAGSRELQLSGCAPTTTTSASAKKMKAGETCAMAGICCRLVLTDDDNGRQEG
ncbi:hypothetical protein MUK42_34957 [Musa troglodytarum]|uniref:Uncharacterized protein n=1 Tax=Musa troglodytarum TaxID=320322 RepID=A0A9E7E9Q8_9LILI|nr:hypothetical protein MUK42_34957 [Musa troglodytarum]